MKNYMKYKKAMAVSLCGAMMIGLCGCGAAETEKAEEVHALTQADEDLASVLEDSLDMSSATDCDKDETVYVIADATGKKQSVIVSDWLRNANGDTTINDVSNLSDIKNVKGDEAFTQKGTALSWEANGSQIYYQGTGTEELPVGVKVTYYLEGKEVQPSEIAGKSGKVKIRVDYTNNSKDGDVYTPFLMATGMILDNDVFSNVNAENAKVISDGNKSIIVGMGFPGLSESLGLDDSKVEIPEYFEVTADAEKFDLEMTVTLASTGFLNEVDEKQTSVEEIEDTIDDLVNEYSDGVSALCDGIKQYTDGVSQVADGANKVEAGANELYKGTVQVSDGVSQAKEGTGTIKSYFEGEDGIIAGAKKISDGLAQLNQAVQGISLPSGNQELSDEQKAEVTATVTNDITTYLTNPENQQKIAAGVDRDAVTNEAEKNGAEAAPSKTEVYQEAAAAKPSEEKIGAEITSGFTDFLQEYATSTGEKPDEATQKILLKAYQSAYGTAYKSGYETGYGLAYSSAFKKAYGSAYETAYGSGYKAGYAEGYKGGYATAYQAGIKYGAGLVLTQVNAFASQIDTLKSSVSQLSAGATKLYNGLTQIYGGITQLSSGLGLLKKNMPALTSGAKDLSNGSTELANGANKLDANSQDLVDGSVKLSDGTDKIVDAINDAEIDVEDLADNIDAVVTAGSNYKTYSGISDDMTGNCKFIIRTDAVSAN